MRPRVSRRAFLAGAGAALGTPWPFASAALGFSGLRLRRLRVGVMDPGAPSRRELLRKALQAWCDDCEVGFFESWGSLADHFTAPFGGGIDAALLPRSALGALEDRGAGTRPFVLLRFRATEVEPTAGLLLSPALSAPRTHGAHGAVARSPKLLVVARALTDPRADARLLTELRVLGLGSIPTTFVELASPMLPANVAAGRVDAALLTGSDVEASAHRPMRDDMRLVRLGPVAAMALSPQLALVARLERGEAHLL